MTSASRLQVVCRCQAGVSLPVRFGQGLAEQEVVEVEDRWPAEDYEYLRVRTADASIYILKHDLRANAWQIHFFERPTRSDKTR